METRQSEVTLLYSNDGVSYTRVRNQKQFNQEVLRCEISELNKNGSVITFRRRITRPSVALHYIKYEFTP